MTQHTTTWHSTCISAIYACAWPGFSQPSTTIAYVASRRVCQLQPSCPATTPATNPTHPPVVVELRLLPWVLAVAVGVPQAEEGAASNIIQRGSNTVAVLGAATHTPLRNHQLHMATQRGHSQAEKDRVNNIKRCNHRVGSA